MNAIKLITTTAFLTSVVSASYTFAASGTSGQINFTGTIVEDPCSADVNEAANQLTVICPSQKQKALQSVSMTNLDVKQLNYDQVHFSVDYLNTEKTLAIVNMTYK